MICTNVIIMNKSHHQRYDFHKEELAEILKFFFY